MTRRPPHHPLFDGSFGYAEPLRQADPGAAEAADARLDAALAASPRLAAAAAAGQAREVLAVIPVDPTRPNDVAPIVDRLAATRHRLRIVVDDSAEPRTPKINRAAALSQAAGADWLIVVDSDVALPPRFLDTFLALAEQAGLVLAQPAHRRHSHASYATTQRQPGSLVRRTRFVEVGPVVAIARPLLASLLPLPVTRSGWGIDFLWSDRARQLGWRIGIVDGTPIEHLRPLRREGFADAVVEASALLDRHGPIAIGREEMLGFGEVALRC